MKKLIAILGLHLAFLSAPILNADHQEAFKICACLASSGSESEECADILFDSSDDRIDGQNLTVPARKKLSAFFQKATAEESKQFEKELEDAHGLAGKLSFLACRNMSKHGNNDIDDLTALVQYRSNAHWMSTHQEEAEIFFRRKDVQEIEQRLAKSIPYNSGSELVLPKALSNELEKDMLRESYAQGTIGVIRYQWEMLKRW